MSRLRAWLKRWRIWLYVGFVLVCAVVLAMLPRGLRERIARPSTTPAGDRIRARANREIDQEITNLDHKADAIRNAPDRTAEELASDFNRIHDQRKGTP